VQGANFATVVRPGHDRKGRAIVRLEEIMRTEVRTIDADAEARAAWRRMWQHRIRHLVVTKGGRVAGVISQRDLGGPHGESIRRGRTVRELMSRDMVSASPRTTLRQAANLMRGRMVGSLPVLENDRLVGIVTATDVLDELGRGFTRPDVGGRRRKQRAVPPSWREPGPASVPARRRSRRDRAQGVRRSPLPGWLPRPEKRTAGREPPVPAYIRSVGLSVPRPERDYMRRKLGMKLGKFIDSIERVSVRLDDVNGPRGGVDKSCRIKMVLSGLPSIFVEKRAPTVGGAFDSALAEAERAVRKSLDRRRTKATRRAA
jgi:CBS domain-containing protein